VKKGYSPAEAQRNSGGKFALIRVHPFDKAQDTAVFIRGSRAFCSGLIFALKTPLETPLFKGDLL